MQCPLGYFLFCYLLVFFFLFFLGSYERPPLFNLILTLQLLSHLCELLLRQYVFSRLGDDWFAENRCGRLTCYLAVPFWHQWWKRALGNLIRVLMLLNGKNDLVNRVTHVNLCRLLWVSRRRSKCLLKRFACEFCAGGKRSESFFS